jgi:hypothetical protein
MKEAKESIEKALFLSEEEIAQLKHLKDKLIAHIDKPNLNGNFILSLDNIITELLFLRNRKTQTLINLIKQGYLDED